MPTRDEVRVLIGKWIMDDVKLAVENGNHILEICDVYECKVNQYNPETGEGRIFVDFNNMFLKLKTEASCYPR